MAISKKIIMPTDTSFLQLFWRSQTIKNEKSLQADNRIVRKRAWCQEPQLSMVFGKK